MENDAVVCSVQSAIQAYAIYLAELHQLPGFESPLLMDQSRTFELNEPILSRLPQELRVKSAPKCTFESLPSESKPPEAALDELYDALRSQSSKSRRKAEGRHFTPSILAQRLAEDTVARFTTPPTICDPSAGTGELLVAAYRALSKNLSPTQAMSLLHGVDIDPAAIQVARLRLWFESGGKAIPAQLRVGNAVIGAPGPAACKGFDWPSAFPKIFDGSQPGFNVVLANPPFVNAIENQELRGQDHGYYRSAYPEFAKGAYDLCLVFWARILQHLLGPEGRYALISPTVLLSDTRPWKAWVHQYYRPDQLIFLPVDFFPIARVRTTVFCGSSLPASSCQLVNYDAKIELPEQSSLQWSEQLNWYEQFTNFGCNLAGHTATLGSRFEVRAGATTGEAYRLSATLRKASTPPTGKQLITTGLIDRYQNKWGLQPARFLGEIYSHPRWPVSDQGLRRCLEGQNTVKVLIGGLTTVIEAWCDRDNVCAGVVQTWVIPTDSNLGLTLCGILNSAIFSRIYVSRHGVESMTGRQITIKKKALLAMPIPSVNESYGSLVRACAEVLQEPDGHREHWDKLCHILVSLWYGRSLVEAEEDYTWWCRRIRVKPSPERFERGDRLSRVGTASVGTARVGPQAK